MEKELQFVENWKRLHNSCKTVRAYDWQKKTLPFSMSSDHNILHRLGC